MRAIVKNNKKIVLNQIDPSERALIDEFVRKSIKQETRLTKLVDIDSELDGLSFELKGIKPNLIDFKTPCIQVLAVGGTVKLDLEVDSETTIIVDPDENEGFLDVSVDDNNLVVITALEHGELKGNTEQYIVTITLEKLGYNSAIIPVNVSVLYFNSSSGSGSDYEDLVNLPMINSVTLIGDVSLEDLGIQEEITPISESDIDEII